MIYQSTQSADISLNSVGLIIVLPDFAWKKRKKNKQNTAKYKFPPYFQWLERIAGYCAQNVPTIFFKKLQDKAFFSIKFFCVD